MFYIHKHQIKLQYGGPEEGGWWYEAGWPADDFNPLAYEDEDAAYEQCRYLNRMEQERQDENEDYGFTSVLAHRSTHYSYTVTSEPAARSYPATRPHYE